ncbi:hypothetical protein KEJ19_07160 [Candidatus Bathyarchaeota archaeon]|nr:hypothetical protein [Candidatus Bathyarchaeota archaeon]
MKKETKQATADVEIRYKEKTLELKCLVDTGASRSVISKRLPDKLLLSYPLKSLRRYIQSKMLIKNVD